MNAEQSNKMIRESSARRIMEAQREFNERIKPFMQQKLFIINHCLPAITLHGNGYAEFLYPQWVREQFAIIDDWVNETRIAVMRAYKLEQ